MTSAADHALKTAETPSGKEAGDENFPVGSFLLPKHLRPHIALFYAYARAIDDVADNPGLPPEDKISRLEGFAAAIRGETEDSGYAKAVRMRQSLLETGITEKHCLDLISAFKQDAVKLRYENWDELIDYCDRSAAPVGRYLLDLHGEQKSDYPYSDALCNVLQVINHLQDCKDDYQEMDRVYLPQNWMRDAGATVRDLAAEAAPPPLRSVFNCCLENTENLMVAARKLPPALKNRRLAMESGAIVMIAERLIIRLKREDPVAGRVELSKPGYILCSIKGAITALV